MTQVIFTPNQSLYTPILQLNFQNPKFESPSYTKPAVIVAPVNESQIKNVLYCAQNNMIGVRVRSGGHDFEGLSYISPSPIPFVMIDMINLRSINVDLKKGTAWIQSGATNGEIYYHIGSLTRTYGFPGGVCSTVGVGGFISGGGYGPLLRKYGLAADNVIDARLIVASGAILNRKSMGEDLFWAIRGGIASNFGVVLAWKVKLPAVPENVTVFAIQRTLEQNGTALLQKYQFVAPTIDRDLFIRAQFAPSTVNGTRTVRISFEALFLGGTDRLLSIMNRRFPELGLVREDCTEMAWVKSALFFAGNAAYPFGESLEILPNRTIFTKNFGKGKSDYVRVPISTEGLEGIWERYLQLEFSFVNIFTIPYGGKMDEYTESSLPFPNRAGTSYMMNIAVFWLLDTPVEEQERRLAFLDELYTYLGNHVSRNPRRAYVNYNDLDIGVGTTYQEASTTWGRRYFNHNFERLVKIKTLVDPNNFFKHEQSIPKFA
jgi:hypothetical protein